MMKVDVRTEIIINGTRQYVAEYAGNPGNAPEWYVNITEVEWKTLPPLSTGSVIAFKAKFLGRELSYTYKITELLPGKRWS